MNGNGVVDMPYTVASLKSADPVTLKDPVISVDPDTVRVAVGVRVLNPKLPELL